MVDNIKEEELTNPEDMEGDIEVPESIIETPQQLDELTGEIQEKIQESSTEVKTEGTKQVESTAKEYEADPGEAGNIKSELSGIHGEVDELSIESQDKVANVSNKNKDLIENNGGIENNPDFEKILNEKIYPALGIALDDEQDCRKKADYSDKHEVLEQVDQVSFDNIRTMVRMFVDHYSHQGVYQRKEYFEKQAELEEQYWDDFWVSEGGQTDEKGNKIDSQGRALKITENFRMISAKVNHSMNDQYPMKTERIDIDELVAKLKDEVETLKEQSLVTYNVTAHKGNRIDKILRSGEIIPMTEQPEEIRKEMRKTGGILGEVFGADPKEYDARRQHAEKTMDIYNEKQRPVYGALAGGSDGSLVHGGAPQYGEIVLVFDDKIKNKTTFTEGDSMNPTGLRDFNRAKQKMSEKNGLRNRQLNNDHAAIAKALYNISEEFDKPAIITEQEDKRLKYIEAQINGGVSMDDVKEIIINDWEFDSDLEGWQEQYPQYKGLFKLAPREGKEE
ncbi:MAG: DUF3626 domain-containing protein [bacterium]|nr:DUF3626 domain-containing protein [bacterium]